jgi:hypothetical protein
VLFPIDAKEELLSETQLSFEIGVINCRSQWLMVDSITLNFYLHFKSLDPSDAIHIPSPPIVPHAARSCSLFDDGYRAMRVT